MLIYRTLFRVDRGDLMEGDLVHMRDGNLAVVCRFDGEGIRVVTREMDGLITDDSQCVFYRGVRVPVWTGGHVTSSGIRFRWDGIDRRVIMADGVSLHWCRFVACYLMPQGRAVEWDRHLIHLEDYSKAEG